MNDVPDDYPISHISLPINADGDGPEKDPDRVTDVICAHCVATWPCPASQSARPTRE